MAHESCTYLNIYHSCRLFAEGLERAQIWMIIRFTYTLALNCFVDLDQVHNFVLSNIVILSLFENLCTMSLAPNSLCDDATTRASTTQTGSDRRRLLEVFEL